MVRCMMAPQFFAGLFVVVLNYFVVINIWQV